MTEPMTDEELADLRIWLQMRRGSWVEDSWKLIARIDLERNRADRIKAELDTLRLRWYQHHDECSILCTEACDEMHTYEEGCALHAVPAPGQHTPPLATRLRHAEAERDSYRAVVDAAMDYWQEPTQRAQKMTRLADALLAALAAPPDPKEPSE